jgi:hypothetical protein
MSSRGHGADADAAREALRAAEAGDDAEVDLGLAEACALSAGVDEIAGQRELAAAAEREAVDGGDDGDREGLEGGRARGGRGWAKALGVFTGRSGRSRGRSFCPASRRRRSGAGAGRAVLAVAEAVCRTSMMARQVSRPMKSARVSGPMGWLVPSFMPVSMSSAVPMPSYEREDGLVDHRHEDAVDDEARAVVGPDDGGLAERSRACDVA